MAHRSQCSSAGNNPLDPNYLPHHYREEYRLAIDALVEDDSDGYYEFLQSTNVVDFLSRQEIEHIKCTVQAPHQSTQTELQCLGSGDDGSSDTYWPIHSDLDAPGLDLGWPEQQCFLGPTEVTTLVNPSEPDMPSIKEQARRLIKNAQQLVAVVMDTFTDVDIFADILDAAMRNVVVYILLDEQNAHHFINMVSNCRVNLESIPLMCVRTVSGLTYYCRSGKSFKGQMKDRFLLTDCRAVLSGNYSFMWSFEKIHRCIAHLFLGQLVNTFDEEFRILFAQSTPLKFESALAPMPDSSNVMYSNKYSTQQLRKDPSFMKQIHAMVPSNMIEMAGFKRHNYAEDIQGRHSAYHFMQHQAMQTFEGMGIKGRQLQGEQHYYQKTESDNGGYEKSRGQRYHPMDQHSEPVYPQDMEPPDSYGQLYPVLNYLSSTSAAEMEYGSDKCPGEDSLGQSHPKRLSIGQPYGCQASPTQVNPPEQKQFLMGSSIVGKTQDTNAKQGLRDWRISSYLSAYDDEGEEDLPVSPPLGPDPFEEPQNTLQGKSLGPNLSNSRLSSIELPKIPVDRIKDQHTCYTAEGDKIEDIDVKEPKYISITREESFLRKYNPPVQRSSRLRSSLIFSSQLEQTSQELKNTPGHHEEETANVENDQLKLPMVSLLGKERFITRTPFEWSRYIKSADTADNLTTKSFKCDDADGKELPKDSPVDKAMISTKAQSNPFQVEQPKAIQSVHPHKPLLSNTSYVDMSNPDSRLMFFKELAAKRKAAKAAESESSAEKAPIKLDFPLPLFDLKNKTIVTEVPHNPADTSIIKASTSEEASLETPVTSQVPLKIEDKTPMITCESSQACEEREDLIKNDPNTYFRYNPSCNEGPPRVSTDAEKIEYGSQSTGDTKENKNTMRLESTTDQVNPLLLSAKHVKVSHSQYNLSTANVLSSINLRDDTKLLLEQITANRQNRAELLATDAKTTPTTPSESSSTTEGDKIEDMDVKEPKDVSVTREESFLRKYNPTVQRSSRLRSSLIFSSQLEHTSQKLKNTPGHHEEETANEENDQSKLSIVSQIVRKQRSITRTPFEWRHCIQSADTADNLTTESSKFDDACGKELPEDSPVDKAIIFTKERSDPIQVEQTKSIQSVHLVKPAQVEQPKAIQSVHPPKAAESESSAEKVTIKPDFPLPLFDLKNKTIVTEVPHNPADTSILKASTSEEASLETSETSQVPLKIEDKTPMITCESSQACEEREDLIKNDPNTYFRYNPSCNEGPPGVSTDAEKIEYGSQSTGDTKENKNTMTLESTTDQVNPLLLSAKHVKVGHSQYNLSTANVLSSINLRDDTKLHLEQISANRQNRAELLATDAKTTPTTPSESSSTTEGDKIEDMDVKEPKDVSITREESFLRKYNPTVQRSSRLRSSLIFSSQLESTSQELKNTPGHYDKESANEENDQSKLSMVSQILRKQRSITRTPFEWSHYIKSADTADNLTTESSKFDDAGGKELPEDSSVGKAIISTKEQSDPIQVEQTKTIQSVHLVKPAQVEQPKAIQSVHPPRAAESESSAEKARFSIKPDFPLPLFDLKTKTTVTEVPHNPADTSIIKASTSEEASLKTSETSQVPLKIEDKTLMITCESSQACEEREDLLKNDSTDAEKIEYKNNLRKSRARESSEFLKPSSKKPTISSNVTSKESGLSATSKEFSSRKTTTSSPVATEYSSTESTPSPIESISSNTATKELSLSHPLSLTEAFSPCPTQRDSSSTNFTSTEISSNHAKDLSAPLTPTTKDSSSSNPTSKKQLSSSKPVTFGSNIQPLRPTSPPTIPSETSHSPPTIPSKISTCPPTIASESSTSFPITFPDEFILSPKPDKTESNKSLSPTPMQSYSSHTFIQTESIPLSNPTQTEPGSLPKPIPAKSTSLPYPTPVESNSSPNPCTDDSKSTVVTCESNTSYSPNLTESSTKTNPFESNFSPCTGPDQSVLSPKPFKIESSASPKPTPMEPNTSSDCSFSSQKHVTEEAHIFPSPFKTDPNFSPNPTPTESCPSSDGPVLSPKPEKTKYIASPNLTSIKSTSPPNPNPTESSACRNLTPILTGSPEPTPIESSPSPNPSPASESSNLVENSKGCKSTELNKEQESGSTTDQVNPLLLPAKHANVRKSRYHSSTANVLSSSNLRDDTKILLEQISANSQNRTELTKESANPKEDEADRDVSGDGEAPVRQHSRGKSRTAQERDQLLQRIQRMRMERKVYSRFEMMPWT